MSTRSLPEGWVLWNDEERRVVLAYRPDVFDGAAFPAACMPTIDVRRGRRDRRPGRQRVGEEWYVTLYFEPEIDDGTTNHEDRDAALEAATERAAAFANGEVDYRGAYQVPREEYFDRLDELTDAG